MRSDCETGGIREMSGADYRNSEISKETIYLTGRSFKYTDGQAP